MTNTHTFNGIEGFKPCETYIVDKKPEGLDLSKVMVFIYHPQGQPIKGHEGVKYEGVTCLYVDETKHLELI